MSAIVDENGNSVKEVKKRRRIYRCTKGKVSVFVVGRWSLVLSSF